jgi:signal transduction histidine kinase
MAPKQGAALLIWLGSPHGNQALTHAGVWDDLWIDAPGILALTVFLTAAMLALWWVREREMLAQRRIRQLLNQVSEEIIASANPGEILSRLQAILPKISEGLRVSLYVSNRANKTLDLIAPGAATSAVAIRPEGPLTGLGAAVSLCFRNQTLIAVPDSRKSPFFDEDEKKQAPRSLLLVPMFAQSELAGVMTVSHVIKPGFFTEEEQAAMQHLGNQVATALRLQEQKSIRERLFRTEKLAASGQLISGIAGELRAPLASIIDTSVSLRSRGGEAPISELDSIEQEARRAAGIVARLVAFGQTEQSEARPLDIHAILAGVLRLGLHERRKRGIEIVHRFVNQRVTVLASEAQLEQVFLNILAHAEQAAAQTREPVITVTTSLLAQRVTVEVAFSSNEPRKNDAGNYDTDDAFERSVLGSGTLGLGLCRGVVQNHGGDIRFARVSLGQSRVEVDLPVLEAARDRSVNSRAEAPAPKRRLTALLVEPEVTVRRQLLELLAKRGDRVVPVSSAEEAAELAQRLRFDLTFCSVQLPGVNWMELFERVRRHAGTFVLLSQGNNPDLSNSFDGGEGLVLKKPVDEEQLNRICDAAAEQTGNRAQS